MMSVKENKKISFIEGGILITIALLLDVFGLIPFIGPLVSAIGSFFIFVYFIITSRGIPSKIASRIIVNASLMTIDFFGGFFLPFLGAFFFGITFAVILTILLDHLLD